MKHLPNPLKPCELIPLERRPAPRKWKYPLLHDPGWLAEQLASGRTNVDIGREFGINAKAVGEALAPLRVKPEEKQSTARQRVRERINARGG